MYSLIYIFKELDNYNLDKLKEKAKRMKLRRYSVMRKKILLNTIKEELACKKIQKFFRIKKGINQDKCPISLKPINYPCWVFKVNNNKFVYYNLEPLVEYLLSSGNFKDPMTRKPLSEKNLVSIDKTVKNLKMKYKSVVKFKNNPDFYRRKKIREETINTYSDQIRELISLIRDKIEDIPRVSQLDMELSLSCIYYPNLKTLFRNLSNRSRRKCKESFEDSIGLIKTTKENNYFSKVFIKQVVTFLNREKRKYFV